MSSTTATHTHTQLRETITDSTPTSVSFRRHFSIVPNYAEEEEEVEVEEEEWNPIYPTGGGVMEQGSKDIYPDTLT